MPTLRSVSATRLTPVIAPVPPTILVFDSGLGGLTVFREIVKVRPGARFIYAADDAVFPYGAIEEATLVTRVLTVMASLIEAHRPDLVVIACNTASTIALSSLRARFSVPFVGTVPAIKPACAASVTKRISVLGTKATVKHEYTQGLIREFAAGCEITLVGSARLARLAETELGGGRIGDREIAAELAPCFVNADKRTDTVVLACTHYPLLLHRFTRLAPWPVNFIDPAAAIARRVIHLLGQGPPSEPVRPRAIFTSGRLLTPALEATLRNFGLGEIAALDRLSPAGDA
jgi:glutamate racemase